MIEKAAAAATPYRAAATAADGRLLACATASSAPTRRRRGKINVTVGSVVVEYTSTENAVTSTKETNAPILFNNFA